MANTQSNENKETGKQGFASMDPDKQKEIASQGGRASGSGSGDDTKKASSSEDSKPGGQGGSSEQHAEAGSQSHKNQ